MATWCDADDSRSPGTAHRKCPEEQPNFHSSVDTIMYLIVFMEKKQSGVAHSQVQLSILCEEIPQQ